MTDTAIFTKEDMIRKVAGLLATAESYAEQGNDEAANAYVQKAHTLQSKWSIDQAMLEAESGKKTEKIISKQVVMPGKWGRQKVDLAHVIAHATSCTGYYGRSYRTVLGPGLEKQTDWNGPKVYTYTVFGFESDVDHVEFLINSLSHQMDSSLAASYKHKPYYEHGRSFAASFCQGFTNTIGYRLREAVRAARMEADIQHGATSTALVLVSKKQQVEAEMKARVGSLRKGTSTHATSGSGYAAGRSAGSSATIARGSVGGSSRGSLGR